MSLVSYHGDLQFCDRPDLVAGVNGDDRHLQISVEHGLPIAWPVLVALDPSGFSAFGHHDNGAAFVLPYHAPKVVFRRRQRTLRGDELALRAESLH